MLQKWFTLYLQVTNENLDVMLTLSTFSYWVWDWILKFCSRMQSQAVKLNEEIESVNRERKYHQVTIYVIIIYFFIELNMLVGLLCILWWLISKTLHTSSMLCPHNGVSSVWKIQKSKLHVIRFKIRLKGWRRKLKRGIWPFFSWVRDCGCTVFFC